MTEIADLAIAPLGPRLVIVTTIPAYNEEKSIAKVIVQARKFSEKVIVCDDGSTDLTSEIAIAMGAEVIRHDRNEGYGSALRSLFRRAKEIGAEVTVTLDADGQHDPTSIPLLAEPILKGKADVVIGSRLLDGAKHSNIPGYRRLGIELITKMSNAASGSALRDAQSGFRAYSSKALRSLALTEEGMGLSVEILMETTKRNLRVLEVPASTIYSGLERTSTENPLEQGVGVFMSILRLVVEDKPLLLLALPGAISLLLGALFGVWMLQIYATEGHVVTNIALASMAFVMIGLVAIFAGITLYSIGRLVRKATLR